MALEPDFWQHKSLSELSTQEWEALCDGCGRCCLLKLEDEDDNSIHFTAVVCDLFEEATCRCRHYPERHERVPDCIAIGPENLGALSWLPTTCAYRLLDERKPLPEWHPLRSGNRDSVVEAGISVRGRVLHEQHVHPEDLQEFVVRWVEA